MYVFVYTGFKLKNCCKDCEDYDPLNDLINTDDFSPMHAWLIM